MPVPILSWGKTPLFLHIYFFVLDTLRVEVKKSEWEITIAAPQHMSIN